MTAMTFVRPQWIRLILPSYLLGGLTIGLFLPAMQNFANAQWGRAGIAVFLVINVIMPILVIALAAIYPKLIVTVIGGLLATFTFLFTTGLTPPKLSVNWLKDLVGQMGPIVTVATVGYLVLGVLTVFFLRPVRRVGYAPDPHACSCGYSLIGLSSDRCPECGARRHT